MAAPTPGYPVHPDVNLVRQLLTVGRILALVVAILSVVAIVLEVLSILSAQTVLGYVPGFFFVGPAYWAIAAIINFFAYRELGTSLERLNAGQYAAAREPLMLWAVLTLIFGVLIGIILLVAYVKLEDVIRGAVPWSQPTPPPMAAPPPMTAGPVAPPPPPAASAPAVPNCPRCGKPATWVPQYSRWYCYTDAQYL
ncbi:MAG TPA: hypothetical protein VFF67_09375 [Thermoplasmata archaeon]|nr:hypothetical protein [Thermoplasmata archaeon]